jgi:hypothetical protein
VHFRIYGAQGAPYNNGPQLTKSEAAMQFIEAQVLDALHLKLSQRLALSPGSKVFITITPPEELAAEHEALAALSAQGLAGAYGDQEPEYSPAFITKLNREFQ